MKQTIGIYCITNNINQKKYIGLSINCEKRWFDHRSKSLNSTATDDLQKPIYRAIRKYGLENFSFCVLEECEKEKLKEREVYWISYYDSYNTGYNATLGGDIPSKNTVHLGEDHGMAILNEAEVVECRLAYQNGKASKVIWLEKFSEKISYPSFQKMWHGGTWKHIMPEVFQNNPRPRRKFDDDTIKNIKKLFSEGRTCAEVFHIYERKISRTTINDIYNGRRYQDVI